MTKRYKQTESYYKTLMMGFGSGSVYDFGCYLVSLVNGLSEFGYSYTPRTFNQFLKDKGLWTGEFKNYIDVDRISTVLPEIFTSYKRIEPTPDMSTIQWYLSRDYVIVAKVNAKAIGGTGTHFVYVEYIKDNVCWIYDPWFGDLKKVTDRYGKLGNLLGLRVFGVKRIGEKSGSESNNMSNMYKMPSGKEVDLSNVESMKVVSNVYDEVINLRLYTKKSEVEQLIDSATQPLKAELEKSDGELRQEIKNREEQVSKLQGRLLLCENEKKELDTKLIDALKDVKYVEVPSSDLVNKITMLENSLVEERKARDEADKEKGRALNELASAKNSFIELEKKNSNLLKKRSVSLPATQVITALWSALWSKLKGIEVEV